MLPKKILSIWIKTWSIRIKQLSRQKEEDKNSKSTV